MIQYIRQPFLIFAILLILTNQLFSQTKQIKQIDSLMTSSYENGIFNGNILVSKNNKIIYKASFGFTDSTKTDKLTSDYRFNIGSVTKEFSAVALMQLAEKGKLKLDDKVSKFIPELPKWSNEVTIRNLLQYTSGLPNVNWKKVKSNTDIFNDLKQIDSLDFKPGTKYDYNNNNIFLRQFIVERITGMNYKPYVEDLIFKPCNMNYSLITPIETDENIAKGFNKKIVQDKPDFLTGGAFVTTTNLLNWSKCLHSKKIISKKSIHEIGDQFDSEETQSALGQAKFKDKKLIHHLHDGRAGNYEALLVSDINENITIILLSNSYNGKNFEISDSIIAILKDIQ